MDHYRDTAFYLTLWYAVLATIVAVLLIVLNDVGLANALLIAANLALLFALVLMVWAGRLTDRRIKRGDLVLLEAMGGGFTWGATLLRW